MRDISKYVDTESPLYDKLLRLYDENKDFPLENTKGRNIHHIVLRSWSRIDEEGIDNTEENLVSLTAADHILAHFYIWKISKSPYRRSAASAWYFMSRNLIKFGIDENTIICLIDKYNEEIKLCDKECRKNKSEAMKGKKRKPFSEEHKKKLSEAHKGKKLSDETKKKLSKACKGKKRSEEARKNMSKAQKDGKNGFYGRHHTEETRKKIAAAQKGKKRKPFSEETKKHLSEVHTGKKLLEETKKKISESHKGKHWKLVDGKRVYY